METPVRTHIKAQDPDKIGNPVILYPRHLVDLKLHEFTTGTVFEKRSSLQYVVCIGPDGRYFIQSPLGTVLCYALMRLLQVYDDCTTLLVKWY